MSKAARAFAKDIAAIRVNLQQRTATSGSRERRRIRRTSTAHAITTHRAGLPDTDRILAADLFYRTRLLAHLGNTVKLSGAAMPILASLNFRV